jgi:preprotein translocase subunit SecD
VSESDVDSAAVVLQGEKPSVALILSEEGARKFAELTKQNVHKRCAILVDGQIVSAPRIMAPIRTGRAIISGDFTESEARRIARGLSNP